MTVGRDKPLIAIVEDEPDIYEVMLALVDLWGYEPIGYVDGEQALADIPKQLPDLVLLDIRLPGDLSGLDVLQQLRAMPLTATMPIVIMTAYSAPDITARAMQAGATDFMFKPLPKSDELKARLDAHMQLLQLDQEAKQQTVQRRPIFISYSRRDWTDFVEPLVQRLREAGIDHWIDQELIEGSDDWLDEINKALKIASAVLVCVSPDALQSRYVKMEYRYAFNNGKRLYPLMLRPSELPAELQIIHYYDYAQLDDLIKLLQAW